MQPVMRKQSVFGKALWGLTLTYRYAAQRTHAGVDGLHVRANIALVFSSFTHPT